MDDIRTWTWLCFATLVIAVGCSDESAEEATDSDGDVTWWTGAGTGHSVGASRATTR